MRGGGGDCLAILLMKTFEQPGNTLNKKKRDAKRARNTERKTVLFDKELQTCSSFFFRGILFFFLLLLFCTIGDGHEKNGEHKLGTEKRKTTSTKNTRFFSKTNRTIGENEIYNVTFFPIQKQK